MLVSVIRGRGGYAGLVATAGIVFRRNIREMPLTAIPARYEGTMQMNYKNYFLLRILLLNIEMLRSGRAERRSQAGAGRRSQVVSERTE